MAGYWQRPEATAEVIDSDGWSLVTSRQQRMAMRIVDRKKDMIENGPNVYPNELEDAGGASRCGRVRGDRRAQREHGGGDPHVRGAQ